MQLNDELWCEVLEWLHNFWGRVKRMRRFLTWRYLAAFALVLVAVSWGLHRVHRILAPHGPAVIVDLAERKSVPYTQDFVANTVALSIVDIRARVEGFLTQKAFEEGADVNEGALIFEIDEAPFKAKLDQAQAQLAQDEAALAFANEQVRRYAPLADKDYVSREDYDNYRTKADEAKAAVEADRAAVEQANLNLGYCKMYSPISGRVGRMLVNVGNLVGAGGQDTKLAVIVQLDPMYVYFAPSSRDAAAIIDKREKGKVEVEVLMPDGKPFEHKGVIDFVDNTVDQKTSTVSMRAVVPNPEKTLLPGLYLQARVELGVHPDAVLVPEQAIAEDQQGDYVMIVKDDNTVEQRHITAGDRIEGARIVDKGIDGGESVIISGLQLVRPGSQVIPRLAKREPGLRDLMLKAVLMPPPTKQH
ncbi:MAG: efflux RND transporter periplasmic adaptor subunit [bacterium]